MTADSGLNDSKFNNIQNNAKMSFLTLPPTYKRNVLMSLKNI